MPMNSEKLLGEAIHSMGMPLFGFSPLPVNKLLQGCPFMEVLAMHSIEQFLDTIITKRKIEREGKIIRKGNGGFTGLFLARKNLPGNWISG